VSDDLIVEAFTRLAPVYEETVDREVREFCGFGYREFIALLAGMVPVHGGDAILDVACGTAVSSLEIARRANKASSVVGLDITPAMLRLGMRNLEAVRCGPRLSLVCGSAMKMPLANCDFDAVVCGLGMHHMDVPAMLADMRRVLKDGGYLVMADMGAPPQWRSPWGRVAMRTIVRLYRTIRTHARAQAEADAFHNIHTRDEWRHILSDFGFGQIEIQEWPPRRWWYPSAVIMRAVKETAE
jgi:ubiquinone/menaquinone biosynthesis C-methylase UbiE